VLHHLAAEFREAVAGQIVGLQQHGLIICQTQPHDPVDGFSVEQLHHRCDIARRNNLNEVHDLFRQSIGQLQV